MTGAGRGIVSLFPAYRTVRLLLKVDSNTEVMGDGENGEHRPLTDDLWDDITLSSTMDDLKPCRVLGVTESTRPDGLRWPSWSSRRATWLSSWPAVSTSMARMLKSGSMRKRPRIEESSGAPGNDERRHHRQGAAKLLPCVQ